MNRKMRHNYQRQKKNSINNKIVMVLEGIKDQVQNLLMQIEELKIIKILITIIQPN